MRETKTLFSQQGSSTQFAEPRELSDHYSLTHIAVYNLREPGSFEDYHVLGHIQHQCQPKQLPLVYFWGTNGWWVPHEASNCPHAPHLRMILAFILYWGVGEGMAPKQNRKKFQRAPLNLLGCLLGEPRVSVRIVVLVLKLSIILPALH